MAVLFLIGVAHSMVWDGDILATYALLGLLLLPLRRRSDRTLLAVAGASFALPTLALAGLAAWGTTLPEAGLAALQEAGVTVGFALNGPTNGGDQLRLSAAMALAAGADSAGVWNALTLDAARLCGVEARVGSLERGKDGDFVLWSGDPLNLGSRVEAVYVDGVRR